RKPLSKWEGRKDLNSLTCFAAFARGYQSKLALFICSFVRIQCRSDVHSENSKGRLRYGPTSKSSFCSTSCSTVSQSYPSQNHLFAGGVFCKKQKLSVRRNRERLTYF